MGVSTELTPSVPGLCRVFFDWSTEVFRVEIGAGVLVNPPGTNIGDCETLGYRKFGGGGTVNADLYLDVPSLREVTELLSSSLLKLKLSELEYDRIRQPGLSERLVLSLTKPSSRAVRRMRPGYVTMR